MRRGAAPFAMSRFIIIQFLLGVKTGVLRGQDYPMLVEGGTVEHR